MLVFMFDAWISVSSRQRGQYNPVSLITLVRSRGQTLDVRVGYSAAPLPSLLGSSHSLGFFHRLVYVQLEFLGSHRSREIARGCVFVVFNVSEALVDGGVLNRLQVASVVLVGRQTLSICRLSHGTRGRAS